MDLVICRYCKLKVPPVLNAYFQNQLLAFIESHGDYEFYILKPVICLV